MSQLAESLSGQFDRLPPHSIEGEMCLLASMMLDKDMVGQIVQIVDRDAFYQADHQIIYDILVKLYEQNRPIDAVIVREELGKRQLLDEVGGTAYLATILNSVPSAAHGAHYAGIVREKALLRQLISASNEILRDAYAPHEKAELVLDKAEKEIFKIAEKKIGAFESSTTTDASLRNSSACRRPLRTFWASMPARLQSMRWASCCLLISREKTAHGRR